MTAERRGTLDRRRNFFERVTRWMRAGLTFAAAEVASRKERRRLFGISRKNRDKSDA